MKTPFFAIEYDKLTETLAQLIKNGVDPGMFCTELNEPVPSFKRALCEKVIKTDNNAFIVLGRDRNESEASGCGGLGWTGAGMIDLVVGRGAVYSAQEEKPLTKKDVIGPSFSTDAARVYITQKSLGIDDYFGFTNTRTESYGKSAVAIKADHTRLIARESVRIYAGAGSFTGNETNCNGVTLDPPTIELIAQNENKLQPAVLGENLSEHLHKTMGILRDLVAQHKEIFLQLGQINAVLSPAGPTFFRNAFKDMSEYVSTITTMFNTHIEEINSLDKCLLPGDNSILSNSVYLT